MSKISSALKNESIRFGLSSIFFSLVLCLIFSAFVKGLYLTESVVNIGRTVIKIVSILMGAIYAVINPQRGIIKGLIWGVIYYAVSFILFSALSGGVDFGAFSVVDLAFCALAGLISGIIAVNLKK